jgi:hypothetical protein
VQKAALEHAGALKDSGQRGMVLSYSVLKDLEQGKAVPY